MKDLKPKKIKGKITVLRALPYKNHMVYIRKINEDIFEWLLVYDNQIYSSYMVFTPRNGQVKLSKDEIIKVSGLIWAGAVATIDSLIGEQVTGSEKEKAEAFLQASENMERLIN